MSDHTPKLLSCTPLQFTPACTSTYLAITEEVY